MKFQLLKITICVCVLFSFTQCQQEADIEKGSVEHIRTVTTSVDDAALKAANNASKDWLTYGQNYKEDRYSELNQITKENLKEVGLAWAIELGTKRGIQATPIVVDGIMFISGTWSVVYAIDVRKGEIIWKYDPEVPREKATDPCCGVINRGVALYKGSVFFGTIDGRLVSVDAGDGSLNWEVQTVNNVDGYKYSITGAPRIAKGKVLIGNGGAEFKARGYVTAYDAATGKQAWRFYTVPGDPSKPFEHPDLEEAAKTWTGEWWKQGGGGTAWDAIVYDPELDQVYIGVGNGTHWNRDIRSPEGGDNLYLSSIVAVDPDDGSYKWHYQTTPGDTWDYTATQPIVLSEMNIKGKQRKVLMQAPKNGFFYIIDRTNGEFLSGEAFSYMNWATGIDEDGRPIETDIARYQGGKTYFITPSSHGAHNWHPMSYNHQTGLMYIPCVMQAGPYAYIDGIGYNSPEGAAGGLGGNVSMTGKAYNPPVFDTDPRAPGPGNDWGRLVAWDPITSETVWEVKQPSTYNGGILSTATGLVFQGDAEGMFIARDALTGEELWKFDLRSGINAPPITYEVDGEQYLTIAVGWGAATGLSKKHVDRLHQGTVYTFKLGGTATAPEKLAALDQPLTLLKNEDATPVSIGNGFDLYTQFCVGCHGVGNGGGAAPDLARSTDKIYENWEEIILNGMLASQGMPNLGEYLSKEQVRDLQNYVYFVSENIRTQNPDMMKTLAGYQYMADQSQKDIR